MTVVAHSVLWIDLVRVTRQTRMDVHDRFRPKNNDRPGAVRTDQQVGVSVGVDVEARSVAKRVAKVGEADGT